MAIRRLWLVTAALALGLIWAGCGDDEDEATTTAATATEGVTEYVGTIDGVDPKAEPKSGDYFVAVAIADSGDAQGYICDATGNAESFTGELQATRVDLDSEDGNATLTGNVSNSAVKGTVSVDGEKLRFGAEEAKGIGGLYTIDVAEPTDTGAAARATSERGNTIEGSYSIEEPYSKSDPGFVATIKTAEGKEESVAGELAGVGISGYDQYRQILLDTGDGRGSPTRSSKQLQSTPSWIDPDTDPVTAVR